MHTYILGAFGHEPVLVLLMQLQQVLERHSIFLRPPPPHTHTNTVCHINDCDPMTNRSLTFEFLS